MSVLQAISSRRSHYMIGPDCPLSESEMGDLVLKCVKHVPSMFNMQSTRVFILYGDKHRALWDLVIDSLAPEILAMRPNVGHEHFSIVQQKLETLRSGHGTLVFFEDPEVVDQTRSRYPAYSDKFHTWSLQSAAIAQYAVWLAMTEASPQIGLTLQHYYPDRKRLWELFGIPENLEMTGQMPFGQITAAPKEKSFIPDSEIVRTP